MSQQQYVITDGTRYIYRLRNGKYVPTSSEAMADIYSKEKAERICTTQLSRPLRASFRIERYDKAPDGMKQVTKDDLENNTNKVMLAENIQRWVDKIADFDELEDSAKTRRKELEKKLTSTEEEIQDCLHYIEFMNLNAAQGYKMYKMLREKRIKRRSIKDEITVLNIILDQHIDSMVEEINKRIEGMDHRQYRPRAMEELFNL